MESKFFQSKKIYDNVTLIQGLGGVQCYLVEGQERALLIDGLTGVGSLRAYVRELTDLPVMVVITHGHIDHTGVAYEYKECFINPDDIVLMYSKTHSDSAGRLGFATGGGQKPGFGMEDVFPAVPVKTYPVYDGDVFDLGGTSLEVIQVPGHTRGTVVLLDRDNKTIYSGDACNANTLLGLEGSTSIEEYLESLQHLKAYDGEYEVMWGGHGPMSVPKSIVDDSIRLCEQILARTDDQIPTKSVGGADCLLAKKRGDNYLPVEGGFCNIVYSDERLHKEPKKPIQSMP